MARGNEPAEARLLSEYIMRRWPNAAVSFRVKVGPDVKLPSGELSAEATNRLTIILKRWADALVEDGGTIWLIEAKIKNIYAALGQLEAYLELLPQTPELSHLKGRQVKGLLVLGRRDKMVDEMAARKGIEVDVYRPQWLKDQLHEV